MVEVASCFGEYDEENEDGEVVPGSVVSIVKLSCKWSDCLRDVDGEGECGAV